MTSYIALLRKQRRNDHGANFSDYPGCMKRQRKSA